MAGNTGAFDPAGARKFQSFNEITSFIWGVADLLRGDYKQSDYGKVMQRFASTVAWSITTKAYS